MSSGELAERDIKSEASGQIGPSHETYLGSDGVWYQVPAWWVAMRGLLDLAKKPHLNPRQWRAILVSAAAVTAVACSLSLSEKPESAPPNEPIPTSDVPVIPDQIPSRIVPIFPTGTPLPGFTLAQS